MELQSLFNSIAFLLFISLLPFLLNTWKKPGKLNRKLPPGPRKLPFFGNLHQLTSLPSHRTLRNLSKKYGPLMHLQLGEVSAIVISSPRLAQEIFKTHDVCFASRAQVRAVKIVLYDCIDVVFAPYGDYWRQTRKLCNTELLSRKKVESFGGIRQEEFQSVISAIQSSAAGGTPIDLSEQVFSYTSCMVSRATFGKISRNQEKFLKLMKEGLSMTSLDLVDLFPSYKFLHVLQEGKKHKLEKLHRDLDIILQEIIDEHEENSARKIEDSCQEPNSEDLIDVLLRIKDNGDLQFPLTDNHIKAIILNMFTGGTETSAATVEWAMSELMINPNIMAKVQREIRQAFNGKESIDERDIQELRYLKLVIKETLRLHPPVPVLVPRECREECEIDGYKIPVKTQVLVNAWAIGRDAEYWHEPESFLPERFENSPIDFSGSHFQYLPFSAGRRNCPGISFGLANVELPLALLLYHFNWKLPARMSAEDLDMTETSGVTASRKNHLYLVATSENHLSTF